MTTCPLCNGLGHRSHPNPAWTPETPRQATETTGPHGRPLRRGFWDGDEFALFGGSASVGVSFSGGMHCADHWAEPSVSIVAFFGVHEDAREVEWADLSPKQARRLARALNRAARLAEVASEEANAALGPSP